MSATFDLKITIYTSTNCPKCALLKKQLDEINIPFEEKNVDLDKDLVYYLLTKGKVTVPILEVNEVIMTLNELKKYLEDE